MALGWTVCNYTVMDLNTLILEPLRITSSPSGMYPQSLIGEVQAHSKHYWIKWYYSLILWVNNLSYQSDHCEGRQSGLKMSRLQLQTEEIRTIFVLCKWIRTEVFKQTSSTLGQDKSKCGLQTLEVMRQTGSLWWKTAALHSSFQWSGPPKISGEQMSTFHKATRHKKHSEECPLHFSLPSSLFYI